MLTDSEKQMLDHYLAQLKSATVERNKLTQRIRRLEDAARSILAMTEDEEEITTYQGKLVDIIEPTGFTGAICKVLQAANGEAMTAVEVRDALPSIGFLLSRYSNPLATVHTLLKRLVQNPFLYNVEAGTKEEKTAYRWVGVGERMVRDSQMHRRGTSVPVRPRKGISQRTAEKKC
jgi:hypothetical protein